MKAAKILAKIDTNGHLIASEPVNLPPGEVEVIILEKTEIKSDVEELQSTTERPHFQTQVKAFQDLRKNWQPTPPDFDSETARWEAMKEKYNL
ncbi:MAG: hypothetical protein SAJ37_09130 [Oscillatoria sp. PMC 1068.18]|nr:hypothetical protein [Oscillatoria sp. PMC 1076.18]MEC4988897.1 hypothetical protein [Oscillatoria sp. PMC 1068.18]